MKKQLFPVTARSIAAARGKVALTSSFLCATSFLLVPEPANAQESAPVPATRPASVKNKAEKDLRRITVRTEAGEIVLHLPAEIAPGDTISGTLSMNIPGGRWHNSPPNIGIGDGYEVEIASLRPTKIDSNIVDGQRMVWVLPPSLETTAAMIRLSQKGKEIAQTSVPLSRPDFRDNPSPRVQRALDAQGAREKSYLLPSSGKAGDTITIRGRFDGDLATTRVRLGGGANAFDFAVLQVLAESPRLSIAETPSRSFGSTQVTLQEGEGTDAVTTPVAQTFDHKRSGRGQGFFHSLLMGIAYIGVAIVGAFLSLFGGGIGGGAGGGYGY